MNIQPNRFFQLSLIFLVALNFIPHFSDYTIPTLAVGGLCLSWRLLYEYQIVPLPNFITKLGLVMTLTYLVFLNYGQLLGLEAGSALLICAVALKLIDRVAYRDAMILLFLNFMLLLARFFESQTLGITIFAAFDLVVTTALLVQLHNGSRLKFDLMTLLKTGSKLVLQIAPFMILLFFIFPRFSTQFINIQNAKKTLSGFSDHLEPGSIASIANSDQVAFRVRFFGPTPSPTDRYWRGSVLSIQDGMKWSRGLILPDTERFPSLQNEDMLVYEVLMEPLFNQWLFVLDFPIKIEHKRLELQKITQRVEGNIFHLGKIYDKKFIYDAYSAPEIQSRMSDALRKSYLQVNTETDQRVLSLVAQIREGAKDSEQIALRLMKFYQKQFRYTLAPGPMSTNTLGEFLFEKKQGFCEHFASSFASLMRLSEVPARVVIGFQGGTKNNLSDYFMVTGRDAHAWTEIWSDEKNQWLRFDPTIMVSPLRFEIGGEAYHSLTDEDLLSSLSGEDYLSRYSSGWLKSSLLMVDAISTNWNLFLLSYDQSGQKSFFTKLGFDEVSQNLLLSLSLLILLLFYLWVRVSNRTKEKKISLAQKAYLNFQNKMITLGVEKESWEGPRDFMLRCQNAVPDKKTQIQSFSKAYIDSEYALQPQRVDFKALLKQL